jgi:hypothetical protein
MVELLKTLLKIISKTGEFNNNKKNRESEKYFLHSKTGLDNVSYIKSDSYLKSSKLISLGK